MKKFLLLLLALTVSAGLGLSQTVLEDFEGAAPDLPWNAANGTFNGIVDNPATDGINPSAQAGSYTKSNEHAYSLLIAELEEPLDLSTDNQFTLQVYAPVASQVLLKLEGADGAIEATRNIAVTNVWQEYTFDFSGAADLDSLTKIIIFFDPGVTDSGDTYLFDNLTANPAGPCAGTVPDPTIIDDFECQRNATYGSPGYADIEVVDNPDPSGINTSAQVGQYTDTGGAFHALVIDYQNPINLEEGAYICLKVWAPVAGNLLFKLEGVSAPVEIPVPVTELNTWVEYCVNFSAAAGASYNKIVLFFNAGQTPGPSDIYYIDDITRTTAPAPGPLEDFEDGAALGWMPLNDDNDLHGTFEVVANPDQSGANTSAMVGSYERGSSNFSTLTAVLPDGIDLSGNPQINMLVWAPEGSTLVQMQLQSPTQGVVTADADVTTPGMWEELNFDFSDFSTVTDFESINLIFDAQSGITDTYYFDNVGQGQSTVDPCEDVEPDPNILDDFECQRNITYGVGGEILTVVNNPDVTPANTSLKVGEYVDPAGPWTALVLQNGQPWDLELYNQFNIKVWAPIEGDLLFKLEGGSDAPVEIFVPVEATGEWVNYTADFSEYVGTDHPNLAIFFNAGVEPAGETYYVDDIRWSRAPIRGCIANFETPDFTLSDWMYFANGSLTDTEFMVVPNPDQGDLNPSENVGIFLEAADGETFAGMFADPPAPIALPADNKTLTMKVWMDAAAVVTLKLERGVDGTPNSGDVNADYTTPGQWQELTWDYSEVLEDDAMHERITIIMNFGVTPTENKTYYFDDIAVAGADCQTIIATRDLDIKPLRFSPNPAVNELFIENTEDIFAFAIYNALGQRVQLTQTAGGQLNVNLDLTSLEKGMYILTGYDRNGQLVANGRFVKQ